MKVTAEGIPASKALESAAAPSAKQNAAMISSPLIKNVDFNQSYHLTELDELYRFNHLFLPIEKN